MTKIIHLIILGDKLALSNTEADCLRTLKEVYPDWKIRFWRNEDCEKWIRESPFALWNFERGLFAYVSDYLRCKILYEIGGLYLDTDVYAISRIPDRYFEKSFLAWDVYNVTTNNGTCFYASEPKLPIFKEFCDIMGNLECPVKMRNGSGAANDMINEVLKKYGLDMSTPGYCDRDQDLGAITVLNRAEFGGRARDDEGYSSETIKPYLIHVCSGTWTVPTYYGFVNFKYAIIYENTDMVKLRRRVKELLDKQDRSHVFIFFMACQKKFDAELSEMLHSNSIFYRVYCVPCGKERNKVLDFVGRKVADINSCVDIMRERNV